jgi:hypothetical protein
MGMFDFNPNADPAAPDSYPTLQLRQRIAEAMLKNASRKGYPKTLGEGLTAIGDAIGERGQMQALMGSQKAIEDLAKYNSPAEIRKREGTPVSEAQPTSQTADAEPDVPAPRIMAQDDTPDDAPPPPYFPAPTPAPPPQLAQGPSPGPLNDAQASQLAALVGSPKSPTPPPYFPTASLSNGPAVPQPNPTPAAVPPAATSPTLAAAGAVGSGPPPEAADNPPIPFQVAQAQPSYRPPLDSGTSTQVPAPRPAPQPLLTPGPAERAPDAGIYDKPVPPPKPGPEPITKDQQRWQDLAIKNRAAHGDADTTAAYEAEAARLEGIRKEKEAQRMKQYENQMALHNQLMDKYLTTQQGLKMTQAKTAQAQAEAAIAADKATISARAGGVDPDVVVKDFQGRMTAQKSNIDMLRQAKIAQEALNNGIISGVGANARIDMERLKAWAFNNKSANSLATNAQIFQSAVSNTLGGAVRAIQPSGGPTSENDMKIATGIVGASPQLQEEAKRRILGNFIEKLHNDINDYEEKKSQVFGGLKADRYFDVRADPIHEDPALASKYIGRLLEHPEIKAYRDGFDEKFGKGAADLEIGRAARAKRYPRTD